MKFEPAELRLMLNLSLYALAHPSADLAVPLQALDGLFDRPSKLHRTLRELELGQFLLFDPFAGIVRLRLRTILMALQPGSQTGELFTEERPLDSALAQVERQLHQGNDFVPAPLAPPRPEIKPAPPSPSASCLDDPYIRTKLDASACGGRLKLELSAQATWSARAFQEFYRQHPAQAREDLGWFLEANKPGARMNTHMNMLAQGRRFKIAREAAA
jgi:hypothetical protein